VTYKTIETNDLWMHFITTGTLHLGHSLAVESLVRIRMGLQPGRRTDNHPKPVEDP
jgi:hypothetical protein